MCTNVFPQACIVCVVCFYLVHRDAGFGGRGPQVLLAAEPSFQPRLFIFWDKVLCSLGWPWAQVVEDGLELLSSLLPSPVLWLYSYALKTSDSINGLHSGRTLPLWCWLSRAGVDVRSEEEAVSGGESVRMEPVSQGRSWLAGLFLFTICLFAFENSLALAVLNLL